MAKRITDLQIINEVTNDDQLVVIDIDDTSAGPLGTDRRVSLGTVGQLLEPYVAASTEQADRAQSLVDDFEADGSGINVTSSTGEQTLTEALDNRVIYVDTIADLQSLPTSGLVDGQVASVQGSEFHWDAATSAWGAAGPVRVEAFGVLPGTVDPSTMEAALSHGDIIFGPHTYTLPSWSRFVPTGSLTLRGEPGARIEFTGAAGEEFSGVGGDTCIEGILFSGFSSLISVQEEVDVDRFTFSRCVCENISGPVIEWPAIGLDQIGYRVAKVADNEFRNCRDGILINPRRMEKTEFSGNLLEDFWTDSGNLNGVRLGLSTSPGDRRFSASIFDNTFKGFTSEAIDSDNIFVAMIHDVRDWSVSNNTFEGIRHQAGNHSTVRAIHCRTGAGSIHDNVIRNIQGTGINTTSTGDPVINIHHNTMTTDDGSRFIGIVARQAAGSINNNGVYGAEIGILGRFLHTTTRVFKSMQVSNNVIRDCLRSGIRVFCARRSLVVQGNLITGVSGAAGQHDEISIEPFIDVVSGIHVAGTSSDATQQLGIINNRVHDIGDSAYVIQSPAGERVLALEVSGNYAGSCARMFKLYGGVGLSRFIDNHAFALSSEYMNQSDGDFLPTSVFRSSGIQSITLTSSTNNLNLNGDVDIYNGTADGSSRLLTGIASGYSARRLTILNVGSSNNITLAHENTGSISENRIRTESGSDLSISPGNRAELIYDAGAQRWRAK